jgi:signal transduction histidine kinase/DNA-binding response OmpR family regulator
MKRTFFKARLSRHIGFWVILSVLLIEALILIPSYVVRKRQLLAQLEHFGLITVSPIVRLAEPVTTSKELLSMVERVTTGSRVVGGAIYRAEDGQLLGMFGEPPELTLSAMHDRDIVRFPSQDGLRYDVGWSAVQLQSPYHLIGRLDASLIGHELRAYVVRIILFVIIIVGFVTTATMLAVGATVITPILRLRNDMLAASSEGSSKDFYSRSVKRNDELGDVMTAFNSMYDQIVTRTTKLTATNEHLRREIAERKRMEEALRKQNEYLSVLHDTTLGLISRLNLNELLADIVTRAGQIMSTSHGFIFLAEPGEAEIECKVGIGAFFQQIGFRLKPGEGLAGKVWQTGQPLIIDDYDNWLGRSPDFEYNVIRAMIGLPLKSDLETIGVIGLAYDVESGQLFGEDQIKLVNRFAQLASVALDNAWLYAEVKEAKETAETANQAKSRFLANMSHELRTPLNAIIGYGEMLIEDAEDQNQESFIPDLQKIHAAGKHLLTLINDILDLSKVEAGKMELYLETFDIPNMIDDMVSTIHPLAEKKANTLEVLCANDLGVMTADLTKVRQTLFNLLSNACKFTEKGTISLDVTRESEDGADWVTLRVRDTGIGMSAEQMGKLFQAFRQVDLSTTRKFGGTGLGLLISQSFCRMMGGDITVESELGVRTTFTVRLPAEVSEQKAKPEFVLESQSKPRPKKPNTVLVIDDDPTVHDLMKRYLSKEGFRVETALNGEEGLRLAEKIRPDFITLDVLMPRMDGWAVLAALKSDPKLTDIPVMMLTIVDDKNMGFALGASDYMTKPIDRERLAAILEKYQSTPIPRLALVVEDDIDTREMLRRLLEKEGWAVSEAENGRVALEHVAKTPPGLILLDLMMPDMDGFQFTTELRNHEAWRSIPIVVVTAKDLTVEDRLRLNGYVEKIIQKEAYSSEVLLAEVRDLVKATFHQKI